MKSKAALIVAFALILLILAGSSLPFARRVMVQRSIVTNDASGNQSVTFYGKVVDHEGRPLEGALLRYQVETFNSSNILGDPNARTHKDKGQIGTDQAGRFTLPLHGTTFRINEIWCPGYEWVRSYDYEESRGRFFNHAYQLGVVGQDAWYQSQVENPAVFVMLAKDVKRVVHVQMSRGGMDWIRGTWMQNQPFWPTRTIPKGVVFEEPTSQPADRK